jgi:hypothetical protein
MYSEPPKSIWQKKEGLKIDQVQLTLEVCIYLPDIKPEMLNMYPAMQTHLLLFYNNNECTKQLTIQKYKIPKLQII